MSLIFDEYNYALNLLQKGFKDYLRGTQLLVLAKYFFYLGQSKKTVRESILNFTLIHDPYFNDVLNGHRIDKAIKNANKKPLRFSQDVLITEKEIETIKSLKNNKVERILFVLLVIARKSNMDRNTEKEVYYVNSKFSSILSLSRIYLKKDERDNIRNGLNDNGIIKILVPNNISTETGIEGYQLFYADKNSGSCILVTDLNNIVSFYPHFCEKCGKILDIKSNRQKMCHDCWEIREKEIKKKWWNNH
jgi:hypothetical protein